MNILLISPGFPVEMPRFTRGLGEVGATVLGIGDQPASLLPDLARHHLAHYIHVASLWDEAAVIEEVRELARRVRIDRVESLWEPAMILAARVREAMGLPGMNVQQVLPFRDKELMKQRLDAAGVRTPRHFRASTADQCRAAAEAIGFPLIIKPIAGAGSADTYRLDDARDLDAVLPLLRHVPEVSVEEFIDGVEYTFDTICVDGRLAYENVSWYRPHPLVQRQNEWISPQTVAVRHLDQAELNPGREMGRRVLDALGFVTGFTHMEWFLKSDGEAVFGEIAARPPGARSVDIMNETGDVNVFRDWASAVALGRVDPPAERRFNAAVIFKRAIGDGRIARIEGLESILGRYGPWIRDVDLNRVGAPRRDWKRSQLSDGPIGLRPTELSATLEMADRVGTDLRLYAE